jgi:hypothetical protein
LLIFSFNNLKNANVMIRIFNAKTAIVACLAVTTITLSSFSHTSPALLGSNQAANMQLADGTQKAVDAKAAVYLTPVPTVYVVPLPYTRIITATRYITQTDLLTVTATATIIPSQTGQGVLSPTQQIQNKLNNLD